jgi:GAF domain-containing protein
MRRRSRAGGEPVKARRRKTATLKHRNAPKAVRRRRSPTAVNLEAENVRLSRERDESLEQLSAASEVLKVISSSPGELKSVFEAILEKATRICQANFGTLYRFEGDAFHLAATVNAPQEYADFLRKRGAFQPIPGTLLDRVMRTRQVSHTVDDIGLLGISAKLAGARSAVCVPMLKDDGLIGAIFIYRQEVRPFTDKQIALVQNFAAQAVIAIENTRLLNELRQSLEQQTATADVLRVISSSPGELESVFQTMLENATRICGAKFSLLLLLEGDAYRYVALHGAPPAFAESCRRRKIISANPGTAMGRAAATKKPVQFADIRTEPAYINDPERFSILHDSGARTFLSVPMLKDNDVIGAINIYRQEVRPFTDKQIALVQNFAAQAVIAIENARLLNELRQRTADLSDSLEQQTATSEVLRVISSSPSELDPVFQSMLVNAMRICEAEFGHLLLYDGECFRAAYLHNLPPAYRKFWEQGPVRVSTKLALGRLPQTKEAIQITDLKADRAYGEGDPLRVATVDLGGAQTLLCVPMLKENQLVGAIVIYRQEARPFTDKQVELVKNFASQAVIAIENTRLLNELRQRTTDLTESLEQQTATSEVLKVISSSPGELEPVFNALLANAIRICEATFGNLLLFEGSAFRAVAVQGKESYKDYVQRNPLIDLRENPGVPLDRIATTKQVVHVPDLRTDQSYTLKRDPIVRLVEVGGIRTLVGVPMLKEGELIGSINLYRQEVRPFTDKQIELVQNFAAQAVIAIENARLLNELRQRTDDLSESLERQTATSEVLKVISSSQGDLQPVFDAILANATDLCGASFASLRLSEGDQFRTVSLYNAPAALVEHWRSTPLVRPHPESAFGRAALTKQVIQIDDVRESPAYNKRDPISVAGADLGGYRTVLSVPMLKEDVLVGVILIYRQEVRPFTEKQIELVKSFASQAVIAIENTRLLNELRESLQQQTATADVLKVISRSTFDLKVVLKTLIESAARLCEADMASIPRVTGTSIDVVATYGYSSAFEEFARRNPTSPGRGTVSGRAVLEGRTVHIPDVLADPEYDYGEGQGQKVGGFRTLLGVPLLREGIAIGVLVLARSVARPFTSQQINLATTFADQAVIAIENVRLFEAEQQRSRELGESLEQQTATADVLKVISRSTFDLQAVLQTLVESAARFCGADKAMIVREKEGVFYAAEIYGYSRQFIDYIKNIPIRAERGTASGRALVEGRVVHIADVKADPEYTLVEAPRLGDFRTALSVPMLREGISIGVLALTRSEVQPFTDQQIELVTTFADQASIAIENVRLFDEIQDKSRQLEEASQHKSQFLAN